MNLGSRTSLDDQQADLMIHDGKHQHKAVFPYDVRHQQQCGEGPAARRPIMQK